MTKCYLKRKIRELEREIMNAKQSLKAAAKHIEDLEHYNRMAKRDIKAYNLIIDGLIAGTVNPCDWCDEQPDCAPSNQGKGCKEWVLKFDLTDAEVKGVANDQSEGVSDGSSESGAADEIVTGATGSLS